MPIEQNSPELGRLLATDQEVEELGSGYGGDMGPAEGPVWWKEGGHLRFSDMHNQRRMKWDETEGVTLLAQLANNANGLTRDLHGRIIACQHVLRRVARLEHDRTVTVVAGQYNGTKLNHPNDVVVKSDGSIYFTDPGAPDPELDLDFSGVYRVSPDLGNMTLLVRDFVVPNGLAFSPDESVLYIDDSHRGHIRAFDLQPNGTLALGSNRVFCDMKGERPGMPDGMKVDVEGNVYCTGPGGVWVIDSSGKHLGTILTGAQQTTNCAWGGDDWMTLFITTFHTLARIRVKVPGVPVSSLNG